MEHHLVTKIFSIKEPIWVFKTGVQRAEYQDRQDLGFILKAGNNLRVRQVNPEFEKLIVLLLLPFDETHSFLGTLRLEVTNEWNNIIVHADSVPFADTPYGNTSADLEFQALCAGVAPLPVYQRGDNETKFFIDWTKHNSSFALAKNTHIQLLIPIHLQHLSKHLAYHNNLFGSLNDILDFFKSFINFLDSLLGFDGSSYTNQVPENRHFMTATKSKWFYDSFQLRYLDLWIQQPSVDLLNEISGGYYYLMHQALFDSNYFENYYHSGNILRKFYNILFEFQYFENVKPNDSLTNTFSHVKFLETTELLLYIDFLSDNNIFNSTTPYGAEIIFLLILTQSAGTNALTEMHKGYRSAVNQEFVTEIDNSILLNKYCSEYSLIDYTSLFNRWGYSVRSNVWNMYPAAAMLVDVVPVHILPAARALLVHRVIYSSNFQLVLNEDIAPLGLRGNLTLRLQPDLNYVGMHVFIKDGINVITEKVLRQNISFVEFRDLPNGIYTVEFRGKLMQQYIPNQQYVFVNEKQEPITFNFEVVNGSAVLDPVIHFFGYNDQCFALLTITFTRKQKTLQFKISGYNPNFLQIPQNGEVYASVQVTNETGKKYEKVIKELAEKVDDIIDLVEGDIIKVYHNETKQKLRSLNAVIDFSSNENSWLVTTHGLVNLELNNKPLISIDLCAEAIFKDFFKRSLSFYLSEEKKQLLAAIHSLPARHRELYFGKYGVLFPQSLNIITLVMKSDHVNALEGLIVQLENDKFVQQRSVQYGEVHFQNLPFGSYFVKFPKEELRYLDVQPTVIFVDKSEFVKNIVFKKIRKIKLDDAFIKYTANMNMTIEKVVITTVGGTAIMKATGITETPELNVNAYVLVRDVRGFEKYNKIIEANQSSILEPGDVMEVYRIDAIDQLKQASVWMVTDYGIQRTPEENVKEIIEETANAVEKNLARLCSAIFSLAEPDRAEYRMKYVDLLSCYSNETRYVPDSK
ncbi:uncharacterized protein LOC113230065 [Hyposmocoma kahamanoa]|uniref:uncharacterized protein LOC113230065 n=1 Tax=Hyposmocoma kahamanoa TaxID=1477025 RepID=UPI000E6D6C03|nr:uncharacterized protein LOC113230065 [Hyposmocoma kahamanoa]